MAYFYFLLGATDAEMVLIEKILRHAAGSLSVEEDRPVAERRTPCVDSPPRSTASPSTRR